jgi:hypothetical protein
VPEQSPVRSPISPSWISEMATSIVLCRQADCHLNVNLELCVLTSLGGCPSRGETTLLLVVAVQTMAVPRLSSCFETVACGVLICGVLCARLHRRLPVYVVDAAESRIASLSWTWLRFTETLVVGESYFFSLQSTRFPLWFV